LPYAEEFTERGLGDFCADARGRPVSTPQGAKVEAAEGGKVEFHGINDEAAKALWNHREPTVKGHLPNATIKLQ